MSGICPVTVVPLDTSGRFYADSRPCGEPATVHLTAGCVHEHVTGEDLCERHAARVAGPERDGICVACWKAGHRCVLLARVMAP